MGSLTVVGTRMREARSWLGLSQKGVGVLIGIDEFSAGTRINRYEAGVHEPDVRTARAIAMALKVPLPYLFAEDDDLARIILLAGKMSRKARRELADFLESKERKDGRASKTPSKSPSD